MAGPAASENDQAFLKDTKCSANNMNAGNTKKNCDNTPATPPLQSVVKTQKETSFKPGRNLTFQDTAGTQDIAATDLGFHAHPSSTSKQYLSHSRYGSESTYGCVTGTDLESHTRVDYDSLSYASTNRPLSPHFNGSSLPKHNATKNPHNVTVISETYSTESMLQSSVFESMNNSLQSWEICEQYNKRKVLLSNDEIKSKDTKHHDDETVSISELMCCQNATKRYIVLEESLLV
uniref:Uncharacterized protein n=1 Tax=Corethron hystrix TaxID=216773 RepID=A0A6U5DIH3_9STRA|mmetsp:Transcript_12368/g.27138  ORF Transcript_12368/g.27138 Transcript_12368/m.27138 type:complete len:234 (+) Transcript_12368:522-1223(+)